MAPLIFAKYLLKMPIRPVYCYVYIIAFVHLYPPRERDLDRSHNTPGLLVEDVGSFYRNSKFRDAHYGYRHFLYRVNFANSV